MDREVVAVTLHPWMVVERVGTKSIRKGVEQGNPPGLGIGAEDVLRNGQSDVFDPVHAPGEAAEAQLRGDTGGGAPGRLEMDVRHARTVHSGASTCPIGHRKEIP